MLPGEFLLRGVELRRIGTVVDHTAKRIKDSNVALPLAS